MHEILNYPYLLSSLAMLLIVLLTAALLPGQRRRILTGGLLGAPFGMLSFEFVPDYWEPEFLVPVYIGGQFAFGLADIVFSFVTGALAWLFVTAGTNGAVTCNTPGGRVILRFLMFGIPGVALSRLLKLTVLPDLPMVATFISIAVMTIVYLRAKPWSLSLALPASLRFTAVYTLYMLVVIATYPAFLASWETSHRLPFDLLGLPAWEIAWAAVYGLVFPMFQLTVLDARWQPAQTGAVAVARRSRA